MNPETEVTAVVVSWNTADLLEDCLRSIDIHGAEASSIRTIVVDNASDDDSVVRVRERWPHVDLVANRENVGFCRANNQALERTTSPWLLLVNADAQLTEGALDAMLERGRRDLRAGVIAPRLVYGDGRFQRWTAGAAPTLRTVGAYLAGLDRFSRQLPALTGTYLGHDAGEAFQPEWVSSACMLVRREALDDVGPLDERIFVYMDDVELCQRLRDGGWNVWYEPAATVVHLMGQSTVRRTGKASPEALRAFNRYFANRHGRRQLQLLRTMQVAGFGARAAVYAGISVLRPGGHHRAAAAAHLTHLRLCLEPTEETT